MDCELKLEKLKILYDEQDLEESESSIYKLKQSLNYYEYLVSRYLSHDATKMKSVSQSLKENKKDDALALLEIYGVINEVHAEQLILYLKKNSEEDLGKKFVNSDSYEIEEIKTIIRTLKKKPKMLNATFDQAENDNELTQIVKSKICHDFVNSSVGTYYCTFHALL